MSDMPEYAEWLERLVMRLLKDPESVAGIVVAIIGANRTVETGYWQCDFFDKMSAAGLIQRDAILHSVEGNKEGPR